MSVDMEFASYNWFIQAEELEAFERLSRIRLSHTVLETLDAVLDVGGVYDPSQDCYDHHQKGFGKVFGHGFCLEVALLNGITMGGGAGISIPRTFRVAIDKTI